MPDWLDNITDNFDLDDAFDLYTWVDDYRHRDDDVNTLNANNPWGPANAAAARELTQMINDGGETYMNTDSAQRQYNQHIDTGNRHAAATGNLRDTYSAGKRSTGIWDDMITARQDFLRGIPSANPNAGADLIQANDQSRFNQGQSWRTAFRTLGGIFGPQGNNPTQPTQTGQSPGGPGGIASNLPPWDPRAQ